MKRIIIKRVLFNFLSVKEKNKINDNELENVITFIKHNQPEELNWKENDVENSILKYIIERDTPPPQDFSAPQPPSLPHQQPPNQETITIVKEKIKNFKDINDLKK